jgi:hypothetical protein
MDRTESIDGGFDDGISIFSRTSGRHSFSAGYTSA